MLARPHDRPTLQSSTIRKHSCQKGVSQRVFTAPAAPEMRETKRISNVHRHAIKSSPDPEAEGVILPVTRHSGDEQVQAERG